MLDLLFPPPSLRHEENSVPYQQCAPALPSAARWQSRRPSAAAEPCPAAAQRPALAALSRQAAPNMIRMKTTPLFLTTTAPWQHIRAFLRTGQTRRAPESPMPCHGMPACPFQRGKPYHDSVTKDRADWQISIDPRSHCLPLGPPPATALPAQSVPQPYVPNLSKSRRLRCVILTNRRTTTPALSRRGSSAGRPRPDNLHPPGWELCGAGAVGPEAPLWAVTTGVDGVDIAVGDIPHAAAWPTTAIISSATIPANFSMMHLFKETRPATIRRPPLGINSPLAPTQSWPRPPHPSRNLPGRRRVIRAIRPRSGTRSRGRLRGPSAAPRDASGMHGRGHTLAPARQSPRSHHARATPRQPDRLRAALSRKRQFTFSPRRRSTRHSSSIALRTRLHVR